MRKWRRKDNEAVVFDAIRLNEDNIELVAKAFDIELVEEFNRQDPDINDMQYGLNVSTPYGMERASLGMYFAKAGTHQFVYRVRPFEELFEPVDGPPPPPESIGDAYMDRGMDPAAGKRI